MAFTGTCVCTCHTSQFLQKEVKHKKNGTCLRITDAKILQSLNFTTVFFLQQNCFRKEKKPCD